MSFIGRLLAPGSNQEPRPLRLSTRTDEPRNLIIGRAATAGAFVFHGLSDSEGRTSRTDNELLHQVIVLAGHRCAGVRNVWADGELVRAGLAHGQRTEIPAYRDGRRARLWLTFYDGRSGQQADPFLRGAFIRPQRWRASDRLEECAYVVVTAQFDEDSLTSPPEFIFEVDGAPLYDRRRDSTAGGDGPQRWGDPASWAFTSNPAVAADHYQLGIVGGRDRSRLIFGMGLKSWQVPFDEFQANADLCDETEQSLSGSERRYAANGVLSASADHRDNITRLARAMAAQPIDVGGRIVIRPVQARAITLTLTDGDLVSGESYELDPTPSGTDLVNLVRGTYREPTDRHNELPYPQVQDDAQIATDGRVFEHTLDLDMETSSDRAQRLARIELELQKRRDRLSEVFMPVANILEVGDWFVRDTNLRGAVSKIYEVTEKRTREDLTVEIEARETDPSVSAFAVDNLRQVELPDAIDPVPTVRPDVPEGNGDPSERSGGGAVLPSIRIVVTPVAGQTFASVDFFEVEYGLSNGNSADIGIADGQAQLLRFEKQSNTEPNRFEITGLLPGTAYVWRIRAVRNGRRGDFSPFREITTSAQFVATSAREAVPGSPLADAFQGAQETLDQVNATFSGLQEDVANAVSRSNEALAGIEGAETAAALAIERLDTLEGDGFVTAEDVEAIRVSLDDATTTLSSISNLVSENALASAQRDEVLSTEIDNANAQIVSIQEAVSQQDMAISTFSTSLQAQLSDNIATTTSSLSALSDELTTQATQIDAVRAEAGGRQLLPNYDFSELSTSGFPVGIEPIEGTDQTSHVQVLNGVLRISGAADANVAYGFPAIPVSDQRTYRVTVRHRTSGRPPTSTSLFLRFNELNRALPAGRTHIGNLQDGAVSARAVQRTSNSSTYENRAFPGADFEITSFTYRPTPGTQFAGFSMYNWTAFRGVYEVDYVEVFEEGTAAAQSAAAAVLRDAFVGADGQAHAAVRLVAAASGATPATIELVSGSNGSGIRLGGNTQIDGDLVVNGTITTEGLAVGAAAEVSIVPGPSGSQTLGSWTTLASRSVTVTDANSVIRAEGWVTMVYTLSSTGGSFQPRPAMRLLRGSSVRRLATVAGALVGRQGSQAGTASSFEGTGYIGDMEALPPGTYTYTLQAQAGTASNADLAITIHKRAR